MDKPGTVMLAPSLQQFIVAEVLAHDTLTAACHDMVARALDFCAQKLRAPGHAAVAAALQNGGRQAHDYLRYGLAKEIGSYLGNAEASVKAVYLFEPNGQAEGAEEPDSRTMGLHLIVWVAGQKDVLVPWVQAFGERFLCEYQALAGPRTDAMTGFLAVDVIDDRDVERRVGSGALVASLYTRPIKVWSRFVIQLNEELCGRCHVCSTVCPYGAITISPQATAAKIDLELCQFCGLCYSACPAGAIESAYYDFSNLARELQSGARANGLHAIALTCRGSTPTAEELDKVVGAPGFTPICLPCVGRTPPEFFLKAVSLGIETIAVLPCRDDHCRFQDGSKMIRNRILLIRSLLEQLNYDPKRVILREAQGPLASIDAELCTGCGTCIGVCPYKAVRANGADGHVLMVAQVDPDLCQGCGICAVACPTRAIEMSRFANPEILTQVQAALAARPGDGLARVIGFRCNWCSYGDSDLPFDRLRYSSDSVDVIRVPCVGRIDPLHILWAFLNGADGVFLAGCPPEDCRYEEGSSLAADRLRKLHTLMDACGFDSGRLRMEWIRRDGSTDFRRSIRLFAQEIQDL